MLLLLASNLFAFSRLLLVQMAAKNWPRRNNKELQWAIHPMRNSSILLYCRPYGTDTTTKTNILSGCCAVTSPLFLRSAGGRTSCFRLQRPDCQIFGCSKWGKWGINEVCRTTAGLLFALFLSRLLMTSRFVIFVSGSIGTAPKS
jgi:hypothetical protein